MARRRHAVVPHRHAAGGRDFRAHLGRRQHAAVARLGALRELDFDHLHRRLARVLHEPLLAEAAPLVAATEVAGADLPDQVAAVFQVVRGNGAFAGVMVEAAAPRPLVERTDRVGRQRAETHRRDVEHTGRIRLCRVGADGDAEVVRIHLGGRQRMIDPFVVHAVHVLLAAERHHVHHALGPLVHQRALLARERHLGGVAFDEVLPDLRPHRFQPVAEMRQHRIVAAQGAAGLQQIPGAQQRQCAEQRRRPAPGMPLESQRQRQQRQQDAEPVGQVTIHHAPRRAGPPRSLPAKPCTSGARRAGPCGPGILMSRRCQRATATCTAGPRPCPGGQARSSAETWRSVMWG